MTLNHSDIVDALTEEWATLSQLLGSLREDQWQLPSTLPGWRVHDIVSHLIGTESTLLGEPVPPEIEHRDHVRNPIGEFNERWVDFLKDTSSAEMKAKFDEVTARREAALRGLTDEDWQAPTASPVGPTTYGRFMRIRVFDCWMHELDIYDATSIPGTGAGHRSEVAFHEIFFGLGYAIGKRAKAPDGSRIAIVLTGAHPQTINVEVSGRARVVDALSGPPTTTVTLDSGLLIRLYGGRVNPADHLDEAVIDGDANTGRRIVENLAVTI